MNFVYVGEKGRWRHFQWLGGNCILKQSGDLSSRHTMSSQDTATHIKRGEGGGYTGLERDDFGQGTGENAIVDGVKKNFPPLFALLSAVILPLSRWRD